MPNKYMNEDLDEDLGEEFENIEEDENTSGQVIETEWENIDTEDEESHDENLNGESIE